MGKIDPKNIGLVATEEVQAKGGMQVPPNSRRPGQDVVMRSAGGVFIHFSREEATDEVWAQIQSAFKAELRKAKESMRDS